MTRRSRKDFIPVGGFDPIQEEGVVRRATRWGALAAIVAAAGVELLEDPWEMNVHATRRGSRHYPSMLEDVEAHRPTEIDNITGALVREAERVGVPVPLHTALYRLVKARETSWSSIDPA